jgi:DNA-binding NtrC family response regulator
MKPRVLLVDDDPSVLSVMDRALSHAGYDVATAANAAGMWHSIEARCPDVIVLDLRLPDANGLDLVKRLKQNHADVEIVMLTGFGTVEAAVESIKAGAFHFATKPIQLESLELLIQRAFEHKQLNTRVEALQQAVSTLSGGVAPVFRSPAMRNLLRIVARVAPSDAPVFVTGESGVGKEVIANMIHSLSERRDGPFVKVNCAALPRELIESELFGAVRGAYTGANADRQGLFHQAHGGTILLDEISEMPAETQSKLLRVLQTKEVRPVGATEHWTVDCRIIAATNRPIEQALAEQKLRQDLYYRISTITLHVPPLRERREDIVPLANSFLQRFASQANSRVRAFTPAALDCLQKFDWPGNVRQLENEVQRAVLVCTGDVIDINDLSIPYEAVGADGQPLAGLAAMEKNAILGALRQTGGNKAAAARQLGITRQTLYNKLKQFGIDV